MKKRRLSVTLSVLCLALACGCASQSGGNAGESGQEPMASREEQGGSEVTPTADPFQGTEIVPLPEETASPDAAQDQTTEERVVNNGGYFVGVEDRVYYRELGPYSIPGVALYGEFLAGMENYGGASILSYEPGRSEPAVLAADDEGYGPLYYYNGYLYSQRDKNFELTVVYRINVETGEAEELCNGRIMGGSADGRYLAAMEYQSDGSILKILDEGRAGKGGYSTSDGYFYYVGSDGDKAFLVLTVGENENSYLMQYDYAGNLVNLALLPKKEEDYMAYPELTNFQCRDGKLSFLWEYFEGTGHFTSSCYEVEVPECQEPENKDSAKPLYECSEREIKVWDDNRDGQYSEEYLRVKTPDETLAKLEESLTKWPEEGSGLAVIPQTVERSSGGIYCMTARAHRDGLEDIGWREAYSLLSMKYLYYPEGKNEPVVLAEISGEESPITGYLWLVGKAGSESMQAIYQLAYFMGPEVGPEVDLYLFGAELSRDLIYEFPEDGDIFGDWKLGTLQDLYNALKDEKQNYVSKAPELDSYQGYVMPDSWSARGVLPFHLGFDEEGRINYVRPVVMD